MEHADTAGTIDWRRLLHRWFVEYNPLYLVSATLCIAGMHLISRGLAARGSLFDGMGVAAIAEIYALALVGGAALLTRIGQRRPAVMLALLAALYQGDLTLHTEVCVYLGAAGIAAASAWVVVFVAKLYALAWALKVRPARSALALAAYGAAGLALIPHVLARMSAEPKGALIALWVFSVAALGLDVCRDVTSSVELDEWGRTVLRRSLRAIWILWALLVAVHVVFWSVTFSASLAALAPAALLFGTRFLRSEARAWAVVTATLVIVGLTAPSQISLCAVMATATLALRANRCLRESDAPPTAGASTPFRVTEGDPAPSMTAARAWAFARATPNERRRLLVGALFTSYLAVWTAGWSGGPWPLHLPWLDVALTAAVLYLAARARVRIALAPLAVSYAHVLIQTHLVAAPRSTLGWGVLFTAAAFALLLASLATSYWLRGAAPTTR